MWDIQFYKGVEKELLGLPVYIQARMLRLLDLMETHGANLGQPHTLPLGNELFELRAKAKEGIGRALFCYAQGKQIYILHVFVKKSQKTPKQALNLAYKRLKDIQNG